MEIPSKNETVLSFPGVDDIPAEYGVYLVNQSHYTSIDLRKEGKYTFNPGKTTVNFELLVGEISIIEDVISQIVPSEFALGKNYPNPFNPSTTIIVMIPEISETALKIYNIL